MAGVALVLLVAFFLIGKWELSRDQIVVGNLGKDAVLSMEVASWGNHRLLFIMDKDGHVVWRNQHSPTDFCMAKLSPEEVKGLIDKARKVEWGKDYSTPQTNDGPTFTLKFNGQPSSVYGTLGDTSNPVGALLTTATLGTARAGVPAAFLQLYDQLTAYDHGDAKPWLPSVVPLSVWSYGDHDNGNLPPLPAGLPAVTSADIAQPPSRSDASGTPALPGESQHTRPKDSAPSNKDPSRESGSGSIDAFDTPEKVHYQRLLDSNKYKNQIMDLVKISRQFKPRVAVAGEACCFALNNEDLAHAAPSSDQAKQQDSTK